MTEDRAVQCDPIFDPTYEVLKCVETYLNKEKELFELFIDVQAKSHELITAIKINQVKEYSDGMLAMKCRWSKYLDGNTTVFTLINVYKHLLNKFVKCLEMYVHQVHTSIKDINFSWLDSKLFKSINNYLITLETCSSKWKHAKSLTVFQINDDEDAQIEQFYDYDKKCILFTSLCGMILESFMEINNILSAKQINVEAYELYADLLR